MSYAQGGHRALASNAIAVPNFGDSNTSESGTDHAPPADRVTDSAVPER
jgi:hypothetical protein